MIVHTHVIEFFKVHQPYPLVLNVLIPLVFLKDEQLVGLHLLPDKELTSDHGDVSFID